MRAQATIYTDGACKGNPGKGGFGVYIEFLNGETLTQAGYEAHTTNNRMELMAAIEGLKATRGIEPVVVCTDSGYVQKGISEWIHGWKKKGWRKSDGSPVLNADLWQQLDQLAHKRQIDWRWVKGHAGIAGNEKADELANLGCTGEVFIRRQTALPLIHPALPVAPHAKNKSSDSDTTQGQQLTLF